MKAESRLPVPEFIFLPIGSVQHLCTASANGIVEHLARAPGSDDATYKISTDGKFFGILDSERKRFAIYALLETDPWMRRIVPPTNLPRHCRAHDFILHDGKLIVGGRSNTQENIWVLDYTLANQPSLPWHALDVPECVRKKGKSIDLLYVLNEILVAVDNVIKPKWLVFYELHPNGVPTSTGVHSLRVQSAFETIRHGAESDKLYALYSKGISHSSGLSYVQLYFKDEIALSASKRYIPAPPGLRSVRSKRYKFTRNWSFVTSATNDIDYAEDVVADAFREKYIAQRRKGLQLKAPALDLKLQKLIAARAKRKKQLRRLPGAHVYAMIFCKDWLLLAMGDKGVWVANTSPIIRDRRIDVAANFRKIHSIQQSKVFAFAKREGEDSGVFMIGLNQDESLNYEWLNLSSIASRLKTSDQKKSNK